MPKIQRLTFFKVPDPANVEKVLEAYTKLNTDQQKDGQPYILSLKAYKLYEDPRTNGFSIAAQAVFSSLEDMKYYDEACQAHKALKASVVPLVGGPPMTVYMDIE